MLPKPDVIQLLSHATVFACPSIYEPLGIVNLEAMACEAAVVATATGGIVEVVAGRRDRAARAVRAGAGRHRAARPGGVLGGDRGAGQRAGAPTRRGRRRWGAPAGRGRSRRSPGRRSRGRPWTCTPRLCGLRFDNCALRECRVCALGRVWRAAGGIVGGCARNVEIRVAASGRRSTFCSPIRSITSSGGAAGRPDSTFSGRSAGGAAGRRGRARAAARARAHARRDRRRRRVRAADPHPSGRLRGRP